MLIHVTPAMMAIMLKELVVKAVQLNARHVLMVRPVNHVQLVIILLILLAPLVVNLILIALTVQIIQLAALVSKDSILLQQPV